MSFTPAQPYRVGDVVSVYRKPTRLDRIKSWLGMAVPTRSQVVATMVSVGTPTRR